MNAILESAIAREAGAWFYRLKEDTSPECQAEFHDWLQQSPRHVAEFLLVSAADAELGTVDAQRQIDLDALVHDCGPTVTTLPGWKPASLPSSSRRRVWAAAASVAVAATTLTIAWQNGWFAPRYHTGIGEQREVKLADGSIVQLNTRSSVRVRFSSDSRLVELSEGEALFTVARDSARPFIVRSAGASVEVVGTQFNLYRQPSRVTISVVEGRVRLSSDTAAPVLLDAGQEADIVNSGDIVESLHPYVAGAITWRQRRLEFRSAKVEEVIAEFNRYNAEQIRVADRSLAQRRMTGSFSADQPQALLDFLTQDGGVRVERSAEAVTLSKY